MRPARVAPPPARKSSSRAMTIDLGHCRCRCAGPTDAGPLITWGLVVTRGPQGMPTARLRQNLGIYRQQVIGRRQVIMRWLAHRGGALDFRDFAMAKPGPAVPDRGGAGRRPRDDAGCGHAGARHAVGVPVRRPAARQPDRGHRLRRRRRRRAAPGAGERRVRLRRPHPGRRARLLGNEPARGCAARDRRLPARPRRPVRRPHRLLQRAGLVSGVRDRPDDASARPDLPLDLHRQAARRAGRARRRPE